jgi:predicted metal-dependent HD superfamily phosphohydrolase
MTAQRQEIDHLFLFIEPDGPEIDALKRLGLTETYRRVHPGQGTANACFAFDNLFLELLWLTREADARSPAIARTRLWERSQWFTQGSCPFGVAVRGDLAGAGVPTWDYRPPYLAPLLPAGACIPVAIANDDAALPMLFVSPGKESPAQWPDERRGTLQRVAGFGPVLSVELGLPARAASAPLMNGLGSASPPLRVAQRADGRHHLRLALTDADGLHTHTLDLASTDIGQWRTSLIDQGLPQRSWQRAWASLGLSAPEGLIQPLMDAWAEPQRHYHSLQHLRECLALLEPALDLAQHPGEVELALWFHDAVYDPQGTGNEGRSADWAVEALALAGAGSEVQERVRALIMSTCHDAEPEDDDARLLVDIDLAILGADPARFTEYDTQVREEYRWVPDLVYRTRRREVLAGFLARPAIYGTGRFRERFEAQARENLRRAR